MVPSQPGAELETVEQRRTGMPRSVAGTDTESGWLQRGRVAHWGPPASLIVLLVAAWQLFDVLDHPPGYLTASPVQMFSATANHFHALMQQAYPTFIEVILGFACSVAVAVPLSIVIVYSKPVGKALYPVVVASQVVPKVAVAPVFVILLGTGLFPKVMVAFLIAFFPIVVNTVLGLQSVDPEMLEMVRSMGANQRKAFVKIRFPHGLPFIFSGLKIAMTLAVVGAIVAEFVGANQGLGYLLLVATGNVDTPLIYADLLVMTLMGILLYAAVEVLESIVLRGHRSSAMDEGASGYSL